MYNMAEFQKTDITESKVFPNSNFVTTKDQKNFN